MFKKVLLPIDGSETSKKLIEEASKISENFKSEIILVNVYDIPNPMVTAEHHHEIAKKIEAELQNKSKEILDSYKSKFDSSVKVKTVSLKKIKDNEGYSILYSFDKENCDLIIMGRRGLGTIKSYLLGSVSNYILNHSQIPVMIVN